MANDTSVLSKLKFDTTHGWAIPLISGLLVVASIGLVIMIMFRAARQGELAKDILMAALAFALATAGVALIALANGMRTKLMIEAASIEAQYINSTGILELRQKLISAISDRLGNIVISPATCSLDAATTKTAPLSFKCEDKSGVEFKPDAEVFKLTWHSNNTEAATVNEDGVLTWKATGKANVTADFNGFQSTACVVNCA
jgi:hypothetical protein